MNKIILLPLRILLMAAFWGGATYSEEAIGAVSVHVGSAHNRTIDGMANDTSSVEKAELLPGEKAITFEAANGQTVPAFEGMLSVPENRKNDDSRLITLKYVRFISTGSSKGAPIIYLAGGPGGSGIQTARNQRFALFMAMRAFGDVIALDQRGTGASNDIPPCQSSIKISETNPTDDETYTDLHRQALIECEAFWRESNVDIRGYTTVQSAQDLNDLRKHLGARKITLWGTSYGSHLALAASKAMGKHIDRQVISSAEGLDQTVKMPAQTDKYFDRLQDAIHTQPAAKTVFPDVKSMIRRVHAKLDERPVMLRLSQNEKSDSRLLWQRRDMQLLGSSLIADPQSAKFLLWLYKDLDEGAGAQLANVMSQYHRPGEPISFRGMPVVMDIASGVSEDRLASVRQQAIAGVFGDYPNFPMPHLLGAVDDLDLGRKFRASPTSNVPTLLLSGTLDGRTYPESQRQALEGFKNLTIVTVKNAGHNLFMSSPEVTEVIETFMARQPVRKSEITVPLPDFSSP